MMALALGLSAMNTMAQERSDGPRRGERTRDQERPAVRAEAAEPDDDDAPNRAEAPRPKLRGEQRAANRDDTDWRPQRGPAGKGPGYGRGAGSGRGAGADQAERPSRGKGSEVCPACGCRGQCRMAAGRGFGRGGQGPARGDDLAQAEPGFGRGGPRFHGGESGPPPGRGPRW
jgi:hypothetical protein